ncbi:MAG: nitroreductase family protein [Gammaproteobacteria bacterium]|nr:nitroreductase family protein [Gammaproteobacteria bacterium]MCY4357039.1 nitroreductase family protein [Gammaproteobacteria bacterium]
MSSNSIETVPLPFTRLTEEEMHRRAKSFLTLIMSRRTVREFSNEPVPIEIIRNCLSAAGTAPSGANRQPWHFAVISDPAIKHQIRLGAEEEEREFYQGRAPQDWLEAVAPMGTDANKPFLETAPYLIVIFAEKFRFQDSGIKQKNYYVTESASIATGVLITALHNAGLATLTHTPSPMKFLNRILDRPETEKPLMILVTGYPKPDATVPAITRKPLEAFTSFHG